MRNPTAYLQRCTAQLRNGDFCDAATYPDMPFPICRRHAEQVTRRWADHFGIELPKVIPPAGFTDALTERVIERHTAPHEDRMARRKAALEAQSQVYYVRIGDYIKIGYTSNLRSRLSSLRVDPDAVIATEPGGIELEGQRHREFAAERQGRRENFNPSRRLLAHIRGVLEENGPPKMTDYPSVSA